MTTTPVASVAPPVTVIVRIDESILVTAFVLLFAAQFAVITLFTVFVGAAAPRLIWTTIPAVRIAVGKPGTSSVLMCDAVKVTSAVRSSVLPAAARKSDVGIKHKRRSEQHGERQERRSDTFLSSLFHTNC